MASNIEELTEEELKAIVSTVGCGIFTVDTRGIIRFWNRGAEEITGYSADEMVGRPCTRLESEFCTAPDCEEGILHCRLFERKEIERKECTLRRKDGERVTVLKNARVMYGDDNEVIGGVEAMTDISYIREIEHQLETMRRDMETRFSLGSIIGKSPRIRQVYELIQRAADSDATVLILGESGTGKELAARAIHANSLRREAPFVAVNCSALSETLLESELFGHVKGAFTGAVSEREGRFDLADGGTLFLDEIGDISPYIQLKLLRVLQDQRFERVGESTPREVDVRIIAATHRDLQALMRDGNFREDLYYRLKVFPIQMPPLRERREDIPLLIQHFIGKFNESTGKQIRSVSFGALQVLLDHDWPGNVRELENAIEHAFVLCQGEEIQLENLPQDILHDRVRPAPAAEVASPEPAPRGERIEVTPETIRAALDATNWNRTKAAERLGISRVTLWKKMKKLGIE